MLRNGYLPVTPPGEKPLPAKNASPLPANAAINAPPAPAPAPVAPQVHGSPVHQYNINNINNIQGFNVSSSSFETTAQIRGSPLQQDQSPHQQQQQQQQYYPPPPPVQHPPQLQQQPFANNNDMNRASPHHQPYQHNIMTGTTTTTDTTSTTNTNTTVYTARTHNQSGTNSNNSSHSGSENINADHFRKASSMAGSGLPQAPTPAPVTAAGAAHHAQEQQPARGSPFDHTSAFGGRGSPVVDALNRSSSFETQYLPGRGSPAVEINNANRGAGSPFEHPQQYQQQYGRGGGSPADVNRGSSFENARGSPVDYLFRQPQQQQPQQQAQQQQSPQQYRQGSPLDHTKAVPFEGIVQRSPLELPKVAFFEAALQQQRGSPAPGPVAAEVTQNAKDSGNSITIQTNANTFNAHSNVHYPKPIPAPAPALAPVLAPVAATAANHDTNVRINSLEALQQNNQVTLEAMRISPVNNINGGTTTATAVQNPTLVPDPIVVARRMEVLLPSPPAPAPQQAATQPPVQPPAQHQQTQHHPYQQQQQQHPSVATPALQALYDHQLQQLHQFQVKAQQQSPPQQQQKQQHPSPPLQQQQTQVPQQQKQQHPSPPQLHQPPHQQQQAPAAQQQQLHQPPQQQQQ
ncbi:hypothetical protein FBU30_009699, partial [Linnemannia zychae]